MGSTISQLRLSILHQHSSKSDPMGEKFSYAEEFKSLGLSRRQGPQRLDDGFTGWTDVSPQTAYSE
jgi:catalase (peroxidase I)